jgi:hypothetical protein
MLLWGGLWVVIASLCFLGYSITSAFSLDPLEGTEIKEEPVEET